MTTIESIETAGSDGILKLAVPVDKANSRYRVRVTVELDTPAETEWLPGFFQKTAGAWQGDTLVREDQGQFEARDTLS